jgi:hypothetical protein
MHMALKWMRTTVISRSEYFEPFRTTHMGHLFLWVWSVPSWLSIYPSIHLSIHPSIHPPSVTFRIITFPFVLRDYSCQDQAFPVCQSGPWQEPVCWAAYPQPTVLMLVLYWAMQSWKLHFSAACWALQASSPHHIHAAAEYWVMYNYICCYSMWWSIWFVFHIYMASMACCCLRMLIW